ncbi:uncharacterized protein LOC143446765 isoform X1 [Clavelina lepadiformis]|uniref:uncharacterized protein LOC143446765 isoform X1 n=2 Tax=Clavelina lepadiformis TaxID=159417 RepID=UPI004041572B
MNDAEALLARDDVKEFQASEILCKAEDSILGRGNFGTVLVGYHRVHGRLAVKCQPLQGSQQEIEASRKKFLKEIKMVHLASHDFVMRVEGMVEWEGWIGMVTKYMAAGSLHDLLFNKTIDTISVILLLRICYEVSDAITYIHNLFQITRIAHGDLKPQNILLDSDLHCKVADFGGAALSMHTLSNQGPNDDNPDEGNQYTLLFAAPERLTTDSSRVTTAMDVYSFGVIVYIVLVRRYPESARVMPNLLVFRVIEGIRFNEAEIQEKLTELREEGREDEATIVTLLQNVMREYWNHSPALRPAMMTVRDRLRSQMESIDHSKVARCVLNTVQLVNIRRGLPDEKECVSIDEIICRKKGPRGSRHRVSYPSNLPTGSAQAIQRADVEQMPHTSSVEPMSTSLTNTEKQELLRNAEVDKTNNYEQMLENCFTDDDKENATVHQYITSVQESIDNSTEATVACERLSKVVSTISLSQNELLKTAHAIINVVQLVHKKHPDQILLPILQLMQYAKDLCVKMTKLSTRVIFFERCARVMQALVSKSGSATDLIVNSVVMPYAEELLSLMLPDENDSKKWLLQAKAACWECIAACYNRTNNITRSIEFNKKTITELEREFGSNCRKLIAYGSCCNNLGSIYEMEKKPEQAEEYFLKSHYTFREVDNALSEEKKVNSIYKTINDLARLYENFPELKENKSKEIYQYLKTCDVSGYPRLINKLNMLRLAILLQLEGDKTQLSEDLCKIATEFQPPEHFCQEVVGYVAVTAKRLIQHKNLRCAATLCKCGLNLCTFIADKSDKVCHINDLFQILKKLFTISLDENEPSDLARDIIAFGEDAIDKIKQSTKTDEEIRIKYQSLCMIDVSYWCLKVEDYKKSLRLAEKGYKLLPLDLGTDQNLRSSFKALSHYISGACKHALKIYKNAEADYKKAISVSEEQESMKALYEAARRELQEVREVIKSKSPIARIKQTICK